jgi:hypothetical protein
VDPSLGELRQDSAKLAVTHKRLAADNRDVKGTLAIDERHEARDQFVAFVVGETAQRDAAAEMIVAVGVAAGTTQWTLARDLD